jgi:hypothetical protein
MNVESETLLYVIVVMNSCFEVGEVAVKKYVQLNDLLSVW